MLTQKTLLISILATVLMGCGPPIVGDTSPDMTHDAVDMVAPIDQQPSLPSCPAAQGISGEVLLCADFSRIQSLDDPKLGNWNFQAGGAADCWQISDKTLSNKFIPDVYYYCAATVPALNLTDPSLKKFSRITLSIHYKLYLKDYQHVSLFLTSNALGSRTDLLYWRGNTSDPQSILRTNTFTFEVSQFPSKLNNVYKPHIELWSENKNIQSPGWQIFSLAIIGAP